MYSFRLIKENIVDINNLVEILHAQKMDASIHDDLQRDLLQKIEVTYKEAQKNRELCEAICPQLETLRKKFLAPPLPRFLNLLTPLLTITKISIPEEITRRESAEAQLMQTPYLGDQCRLARLPPIPLVNEGNCCFINTMIQEIVSMRDAQLENTLSTLRSDPNFKELAELLYRYRKEQWESHQKKSPPNVISGSKDVRQVLQRLKIDKEKGEDWLSGQRDALEALGIILTTLSDMKKLEPRYAMTRKVRCSSPDIPPEPIQRELCNEIDLQFNHDSDGVSLDFLFRRALVDEVVKGNEKYQIVRRFSVFPNVLIFHFIRNQIISNPQIRGNAIRNKVTTKVDVPLIYKLTANQGKTIREFELSGIVVQSGSHDTSGHYYLLQKMGHEYYKANDSSISLVTEEEFLKEAQNAYRLRYEMK